jgi:hypothetical protein
MWLKVVEGSVANGSTGLGATEHAISLTGGLKGARTEPNSGLNSGIETISAGALVNFNDLASVDGGGGYWILWVGIAAQIASPDGARKSSTCHDKPFV